MKKNQEIQTIKSTNAKRTIGNDDLNKYVNDLDSLLGVDNDGNTYWKGSAGTGQGWAVVVVDKYGTVLDAFKWQNTNYFNPHIAPKGDVYFWKIAKDGVTFYKITRSW